MTKPKIAGARHAQAMMESRSPFPQRTLRPMRQRHAAPAPTGRAAQLGPANRAAPLGPQVPLRRRPAPRSQPLPASPLPPPPPLPRLRTATSHRPRSRCRRHARRPLPQWPKPGAAWQMGHGFPAACPWHQPGYHCQCCIAPQLGQRHNNLALALSHRPSHHGAGSADGRRKSRRAAPPAALQLPLAETSGVPGAVVVALRAERVQPWRRPARERPPLGASPPCFSTLPPAPLATRGSRTGAASKTPCTV
mmetsp:Transcript_124346/g.264951  ORF Transcript_124346/g.264951 Transcript_124346/m.264951 type:complete len:250 (+) Transcript_124346:538-1287(+)